MKRNEGITTRTNKRTGVKRKELDSPNLRPETVGDVKLGTQVGTIRVGKKEHPLYDYRNAKTHTRTGYRYNGSA